jgi:hypothetical protein
MNVKENKFYLKFKVHRLFHELFGRETTTFDLLAIVISSFSFAGLTLILKRDANISIIKIITLTILALDIAGGAVANFTKGTNNYYNESLSKRYFFVFFHLIQPTILIWIFPNDFLLILGLSLFTLISTIIVLKIKKHDTQIIVAVTLLLLSFVLTTLLNFSDLLTQLFIQLFSLKLILAFSVNWFSSDKDETKAGNKTTTR